MTDQKVSAAEQAVKNAEHALALAKAKAAFKEYPRWIVPHESHVHRHDGGHVSVPHFPQYHVDRAGVVTVLVDDAEHEARALAVKADPVEESADHEDAE